MQSSQEHRVLQSYVDYLNGILNQTITDSRLVIIRRADKLIISRYQNDSFLPLELRPQGYLHFRQFARVQAGRVIVDDSRYIYSVSPDPDNEAEWVFRYEYCLNPEENVPYAHMHLNANWQDQSVRDIHFPTGRVSIEQIVAHLIIEHHVTPRTAEWLQLLADSHSGFVPRQTDLESPRFP